MVDFLDCNVETLRYAAAARHAACFITYDYAEAKDLLKSALTLISGVLVVSITFGEKVVGLRNAPARARRFLVLAWVGLVLAFIAAGLALALMAITAGALVYGQQVIYGPIRPYHLALGGWLSTFAAGGLFVASLVSMVISAVIAMRVEPQAPVEASAPCQ
jgi:hypothetical protein